MSLQDYENSTISMHLEIIPVTFQDVFNTTSYIISQSVLDEQLSIEIYESEYNVA